jgi:hypothetical protein
MGFALESKPNTASGANGAKYNNNNLGHARHDLKNMQSLLNSDEDCLFAMAARSFEAQARLHLISTR